MKKRLITLNIFLSLILFSFYANAAEPHKVITGEELQTMMKDGQPTKIVDVREPELFADGHVPGAINIPYDNARERILKELSKNDRIVFICHSGPMGEKLSGVLTQNGYPKVYNVDGGMRWWKGPLEKSK